MLDSARKRRILDLLVAAQLADEAACDRPPNLDRAPPAATSSLDALAPAGSEIQTASPAPDRGLDLFLVCLGLNLRPGNSPDHDDLILHECPSALAVAAGVDPRRMIRRSRQLRGVRCKCGREESACGAWPDGMALPLSQRGTWTFAVAPGVALVRKRRGGEGITVVTGDLEGAAGRDFRGCLTAGADLPILAVLLDPEGRRAWASARDLGAIQGVPCAEVDCGDAEACWDTVSGAIAGVRRDRRPAVLLASASLGAARVRESLEKGLASVPEVSVGPILRQWQDYLAPCRAGSS